MNYYQLFIRELSWAEAGWLAVMVLLFGFIFVIEARHFWREWKHEGELQRRMREMTNLDKTLAYSLSLWKLEAERKEREAMK
jgi:hypothetical protein